MTQNCAKVDVMLVENGVWRIIHEYNLSYENRHVSFVHDPVNNTFADTEWAYSECYPENIIIENDNMIWITLASPERLFPTLREYLANKEYNFSPETNEKFEEIWNSV